MEQIFQIRPIGRICQQEDRVWVEIEPAYRDGLRGLEEFSHILVLYWFDRNDTPQQRSILQVHPRKNESNPLTGVFATHAPVRPNLIAITLCRLLSIEGGRLHLESIDALDGTPVIDIKCYIPCSGPQQEYRTPAWVKNES